MMDDRKRMSVVRCPSSAAKIKAKEEGKKEDQKK